MIMKHAHKYSPIGYINVIVQYFSIFIKEKFITSSISIYPKFQIWNKYPHFRAWLQNPIAFLNEIYALNITQMLKHMRMINQFQGVIFSRYTMTQIMIQHKCTGRSI